MYLTAAGREYATWTVTGAPPDVTFEASTDGGDTWTPMTRDGDKIKILTAGPNAPDSPPGTLVLPIGRTPIHVRAVDTPEIIIRPAGVITVSAQ